MKTNLSININKFALVRNSRGENLPNILDIATKCLNYGAHGITVHPRPDQRHITKKDIFTLSEHLKSYPNREFNIEGYPTEQLIDMVVRIKPTQVTLVPDPPEALTSSFGWDVKKHKKKLTSIIETLRHHKIRSSIFIDPTFQDFSDLQKVAPDRVELFTYGYAKNYPDNPKKAISDYKETAKKISALDIDLNAGHDLNTKNLRYFLEEISTIKEISIGHALVCDTFEFGLEKTVLTYLSLLQ